MAESFNEWTLREALLIDANYRSRGVTTVVYYLPKSLDDDSIPASITEIASVSGIHLHAFSWVDAYKKWGIDATPCTFVLDSKGIVKSVIQGVRSLKDHWLTNRISTTLDSMGLNAPAAPSKGLNRQHTDFRSCGLYLIRASYRKTNSRKNAKRY
jgi:hypothetical protein